MVGHSPRGRSREERKEEVRNQLRDGIPPVLHPALVSSQDPGIIALVQAIDNCYQPNPKDRSNARTIASNLRKTLEKLYPTEA